MGKNIPGKDRPYKSDELFQIIMDQLKEKNLLPDILDYGHTERTHTSDIRYYGWDTVGAVRFGGNEGIYLDVYAIGEVSQQGNRKEQVLLAIFKTLDESKEAFKRMSELNAEIVFLMRDFVNHHISDFEWSGFNFTFYNKAGAEAGCFSTSNIEQAESSIRSKFDYWGDKYDLDHAVIVDMRDRKIVKIIKREEQ